MATKEETILFSLDNEETSKENERAVYKNVQVKLKNKGFYEEALKILTSCAMFE